eukprot:IDg15337t1
MASLPHLQLRHFLPLFAPLALLCLLPHQRRAFMSPRLLVGDVLPSATELDGALRDLVRTCIAPVKLSSYGLSQCGCKLYVLRIGAPSARRTVRASHSPVDGRFTWARVSGAAC